MARVCYVTVPYDQTDGFQDYYARLYRLHSCRRYMLAYYYIVKYEEEGKGEEGELCERRRSLRAGRDAARNMPNVRISIYVPRFYPGRNMQTEPPPSCTVHSDLYYKLRRKAQKPKRGGRLGLIQPGWLDYAELCG